MESKTKLTKKEVMDVHNQRPSVNVRQEDMETHDTRDTHTKILLGHF